MRLKVIGPRLNPACAKSSAPNERLPRRASQRVSGPRGLQGRTVCAKTTALIITTQRYFAYPGLLLNRQTKRSCFISGWPGQALVNDP
jgi:hypothetical protein